MKMKKCFLSTIAMILTFAMNLSFVKADPLERDTSAVDINIAIVCDNEDIAKKYIKEVCQHDYVGEAWHDYEKNVDGYEMPLKYSDPDKCICYVGSGAKSCYLHFKFFTPSELDERNPLVRERMSECEGVVIIYNISDPSLSSFLSESSRYSSSLDVIERFDTPILNVMRYVKHMFYDKGETMPFEFLTYNKDKCKDDYEERRDKLNTFTRYSEPDFRSDNTWERGHPDVSDSLSYGHMASWANRWAVGGGRRDWGLTSEIYGTESWLLGKSEGSPSKNMKKVLSNKTTLRNCFIGAGVLAAIGGITGTIVYKCHKLVNNKPKKSKALNYKQNS